MVLSRKVNSNLLNPLFFCPCAAFPQFIDLPLNQIKHKSTSVKSLRFRLEQLRQCCPLFRRAALRPLFLGIAAKMIVTTEKLMNNHVIVGPFTLKKYAACC